MDMYHWDELFQALSGYETIPTPEGALCSDGKAKDTLRMTIDAEGSGSYS